MKQLPVYQPKSPPSPRDAASSPRDSPLLTQLSAVFATSWLRHLHNWHRLTQLEAPLSPFRPANPGSDPPVSSAPLHRNDFCTGQVQLWRARLPCGELRGHSL